MIIEISKIYDIKLTKKEALDLSKSLITTLVKLGIFKGGLSLITSTLSSNFTTIFISKTVQSITSCWLIKIVGLTINEYFKKGQKWSEGGIQEEVNKIYQLNKRAEFLEDFIKEAINKINLKNNLNINKKLPPNI